MTVQIIETFKSGEGSEGPQPTAVRKYVVTNTHDEAEVRQIVEATIPVVYQDLNLSDYDWDPLGNGLWDVTVRYGVEDAFGLTADDTVSFDTTGGTIHYTQSPLTVASYAIAGTTAPNTYGAIGIDGENVNGVDAPGPAFKFQVTRKWPAAPVTDNYILQIAELTPCVNNAQFRQFAAGTLLFLGATGSQRGREMWEITYYFTFSKNLTSQTIGGITGISKKGHEYLWFLYRSAEDTGGKAIIKRPIAAYVERLTTEEDFGLLNL